MARDQIDVNRELVAGAENLHVVEIVLELVPTTHVSVAIVVGIGILHCIFDGASSVWC